MASRLYLRRRDLTDTQVTITPTTKCLGGVVSFRSTQAK